MAEILRWIVGYKRKKNKKNNTGKIKNSCWLLDSQVFSFLELQSVIHFKTYFKITILTHAE